MSTDYKLLLALQDCDLRIIELERSKEEFPVKVTELEKAVADAAGTIENTQKRIEELTQEKKNVEEQVIDASIALEKSQERLNTIKTNKEYDAVHAEIETHKNIVATADKRIQKFTAEIETLQNALDEEKEAFEKISAENQPQIDDLKQKIATIDSSVADVVAEKEKLIPQIAKPYIRAYDHIRASRKKGKVISIISNADRNCTVCYQVVPPQLVNQIRKGTDIVYCQSCGSILILESSIAEDPPPEQV